MSNLYGTGTSPREFYAAQDKVREQIGDWLKRDTEERVPQFSRILASAVGRRLILDMPEPERMAIYAAHPPIEDSGFPPVDIEGVYPMWWSMASELPAIWEEHTQDYLRLSEQERAKQAMEPPPTANGNGSAAPY